MTNESAAAAERLSQPHFDDEATLLSARPVIPLAAVSAERVGKRWVLFAAAIAVSVLLGAAGATLIYSERSQMPGQNEEKIARSEEITSASQTPAAAAGTEDVPARVTVDAGSEKGGDSAEVKEQFNEGPKKGQDKGPAGQLAKANSGKNGSGREKSKVRLRSSVRSTEMAEDVRDNSSIIDIDDREWRREERREERRQRRATRQARANRDGSSDDLFRIREIFEGSPRP